MRLLGIQGVLDGFDAGVEGLADRDVAAEVAQVLDVRLGRHHLRHELVHVVAMAFATLECLPHWEVLERPHWEIPQACRSPDSPNH